MKDILLKPQTPYFNHLEVDVMDFPKGSDLSGVMEHYEDWLYNLIRVRLLDDWNAVGGLDETMEIVKDHIKDMFEG